MRTIHTLKMHDPIVPWISDPIAAQAWCRDAATSYLIVLMAAQDRPWQYMPHMIAVRDELDRRFPVPA